MSTVSKPCVACGAAVMVPWPYEGKPTCAECRKRIKKMEDKK